MLWIRYRLKNTLVMHATMVYNIPFITAHFNTVQTPDTNP